MKLTPKARISTAIIVAVILIATAAFPLAAFADTETGSDASQEQSGDVTQEQSGDVTQEQSSDGTQNQSESTSPQSDEQQPEESTPSKPAIETGLYKVDGKWRYYENGKFKAVTGLVNKPSTDTWHYVVNGIFSKETGLVQQVQPGKDKGKWFYIEKGTFAKKNGLVKCIQPGNSGYGKWYYVVEGKKKKDTGLVKCIQKGDSGFGKWYYVIKGKLNKTQTGLVTKPNQDKYYYVKNGKYKKITGLIKNGEETWFVRRGDAETRYTNSSMVQGTIASPNNFTRNGTPVSVITIHHMAGIMSAENCGHGFALKSRSASSNYGIGKDGEVWQYVDEAIQSKCSVSRENDIKAITIEVSNNTTKDPWTISDKNMKVLIELCADICFRNNIEKLNFTGDTTGNLTMHKWFYPTGCPGPYLESKFPYIANEVNKRLDQMRAQTK